MDTQCQHIAGVCAAWISDELSSTIATTTYRDPDFQSRPGSPWLEVVRTAEQAPEWGGTKAKLTQVATIELTVRVMPQARLNREDAAGTVVSAVRAIFVALDRGRHASYQSGQTLTALAGIASITVERVEYTHDPEMPSAVVTTTVRHESEHLDQTPTALTRIVGDLNLDADENKCLRRDEIAV